MSRDNAKMIFVNGDFTKRSIKDIVFPAQAVKGLFIL